MEEVRFPHVPIFLIRVLILITHILHQLVDLTKFPIQSESRFLFLQTPLTTNLTISESPHKTGNNLPNL